MEIPSPARILVEEVRTAFGVRLAARVLAHHVMRHCPGRTGDELDSVGRNLLAPGHNAPEQCGGRSFADDNDAGTLIVDDLRVADRCRCGPVRRAPHKKAFALRKHGASGACDLCPAKV
jgi:hypothetical protein